MLLKKKNRLDNLNLKKRHYPLNYDLKEFEGKVYSSPNLSFNRSSERHSHHKKHDFLANNEDEFFSILNDSYTQINTSIERLLSKMLNVVNAEAASFSLIKPIPNANQSFSQNNQQSNNNNNTTTTTNNIGNSLLSRSRNFSVSNSSLSNNLYNDGTLKSENLLLNKNSYKLELTTFITRNENNKNERRKSENKTYKTYKNVKVKKIEKNISVNISEIQYFCCEVFSIYINKCFFFYYIFLNINRI